MRQYIQSPQGFLQPKVFQKLYGLKLNFLQSNCRLPAHSLMVCYQFLQLTLAWIGVNPILGQTHVDNKHPVFVRCPCLIHTQEDRMVLSPQHGTDQDTPLDIGQTQHFLSRWIDWTHQKEKDWFWWGSTPCNSATVPVHGIIASMPSPAKAWCVTCSAST